jgi:hypothetical protein
LGDVRRAQAIAVGRVRCTRYQALALVVAQGIGRGGAQHYIQVALHFKAVKQVDCEDVDSKLAMGQEFSMAGTIGRRVNELGLIPLLRGCPACRA